MTKKEAFEKKYSIMDIKKYLQKRYDELVEQENKCNDKIREIMKKNSEGFYTYSENYEDALKTWNYGYGEANTRRGEISRIAYELKINLKGD